MFISHKLLSTFITRTARSAWRIRRRHSRRPNLKHQIFPPQVRSLRQDVKSSEVSLMEVRKLKMEGSPPEEIETLYIHIPFCRQRCSFCTFFSMVESQETIDAYMDGITGKVEALPVMGRGTGAGRTSGKEGDGQDEIHGYRFRSIFIGGGTPAMGGAGLSELVRLLRQKWPEGSISVELAPEDLFTRDVKALSAAGCDRVSVGVQSFQGDVLHQSGRRVYPVQDMQRALLRIISMFRDVNIDMIYGFPDQTVDDIARDARVLRELGAGSVTWYPLITAAALSRGDLLRYEVLHRRVVRELSGFCFRLNPWTCGRHQGATGEYITESSWFLGLGAGAFSLLPAADKGAWFHANPFSLTGDTLAGGTFAGSSLTGGPMAGGPMAGGALAGAMGFDRWISPRQLQRFRLLGQLFSGDRTGLTAAFSDRLLASLGGIQIDRKGNARVDEKGEFFLSLGMREFFRGVDLLRSMLRSHEG